MQIGLNTYARVAEKLPAWERKRRMVVSRLSNKEDEYIHRYPVFWEDDWDVWKHLEDIQTPNYSYKITLTLQIKLKRDLDFRLKELKIGSIYTKSSWINRYNQSKLIIDYKSCKHRLESEISCRFLNNKW